MKKLLLVAALGAAGFMNAKEVKLESETKANTVTENSFTNNLENKKLVPPYQWVTVTTECGKVFYLDYNMYDGCYEMLQEDARYFTDAQCGEGYSFDVPF